MLYNPVTEKIEAYGARRVISFLDADLDHHIPMVLDWAEKFDRKKVAANPLNAIKKAMSDHESNWYKYAQDIYIDIDNDVRRTILENFIVNIVVKGGQRQKIAKQKHHCNIPWAILMDPTSACNLHCTGCWAAARIRRRDSGITAATGFRTT